MLFKYETDRLILKVLEPDSAPEVLLFYEKDKDLFEKYEADRCPDFYTERHQRAILQIEYGLTLKLSQVRFYVFLKDAPDTIIGTICLYDISPSYSRASLGYKFSSAFHHKGYATEALQKLLEIGFKDLMLHRICAHVKEENTPSIRLLEKLGFTKEGICRDYLRIQGVWSDHLQYSLLQPELLL